MKNEEIQAKIEAIKASKSIPDALKPKMVAAWESKLEKAEKPAKKDTKSKKITQSDVFAGAKYKLIEILTDIGIDLEGEEETSVASLRMELEEADTPDKVMTQLEEYKTDWLNDLSSKPKKEVQEAIKDYYNSLGGGKESKKTKYRILSPDGFDIAMDKTYTAKQIPGAVKDFKKRFKAQGYYSDANQNKIQLSKLNELIMVVPASDPTADAVSYLDLFPLAKKTEKKKSDSPQNSKGKFVESNVYKGKKLSDLDEKECEELLADIKARRKAAAESSEKSRSKPVIEKAARNVSQAVKHVIESVPAVEIKDNPKKVIDRMTKIADLAKKFLSDLRVILGEDYDREAVDDEIKEIKSLIAELRKKYAN